MSGLFPRKVGLKKVHEHIQKRIPPHTHRNHTNPFPERPRSRFGFIFGAMLAAILYNVRDRFRDGSFWQNYSIQQVSIKIHSIRDQF